MNRTVAQTREQTAHLNKIADQFAALLDVAPENIGTTGGRIGDTLSIVLRVDLAEQLLAMADPRGAVVITLGPSFVRNLRDALEKVETV